MTIPSRPRTRRPLRGQPRVRPFRGLLLAAGLAAAACSQPRRPTPPSVPVTVASVEQRPVPYEITAPGTVEPIRAVAVASQVSGLVTAVRFREGDDVSAGQVLFQIDARPYRNALQQALAALARDQAQFQNAQRQVDRYQALAKSEYVTDEQYQALVTSAQSLAAALKSDSAAVDNARLNLEYTTIRAPISGRTGSLLIKEGNLVRAPGSGALVMLNQLRPILVRFAVPATYLPEIRKRTSSRDTLVVRVQPTNDTRAPLQGTLSFVDNSVDTTTGTILLKGRFENAEGVLWPGQFVTATLVLYTEQAVVVPAPAVMNGERGPYVFVVNDQKADTRPVEVGRTVEDVVIVTKGLSPAETVVTDGQLRLVPGAKVDIRSGTEEAGAAPDQRGAPGRSGAKGGAGGGRGGRGGQSGRGSAPDAKGGAPNQRGNTP